jgi:hypothetical protein
MKLKSEQHYNATWIEFDLNLDLTELKSNAFISSLIILKFNFNSTKFNLTTGLRFNWKKMKWKLLKKTFKFFFGIWYWKNKNIPIQQGINLYLVLNVIITYFPTYVLIQKYHIGSWKILSN